MGVIVVSGEKSSVKQPAKTPRKKPENKKARSDSGYFDSLFAGLGPLTCREINWKGQKYASALSAYTSIVGAAKTRHLHNVVARVWDDRVFVYRLDYAGVLPWNEKVVSMEQAFDMAAKCLSDHADIEQWPFPVHLAKFLETRDDKTPMQLRMFLRDELKKRHPYLSVIRDTKDNFVIVRDKSYGKLVNGLDGQHTPSNVASIHASSKHDASELVDVTIEEVTPEQVLFEGAKNTTKSKPLIVDIPIPISLELAVKLAEEFVEFNDPRWKIFVDVDVKNCVGKKTTAHVRFVRADDEP